MSAKVVIKDLPHKTYSAPVFIPQSTKEDKLLKKNGKQYILQKHGLYLVNYVLYFQEVNLKSV